MVIRGASCAPRLGAPSVRRHPARGLCLVALLGLLVQVLCLMLALRVYRSATRGHAAGELLGHIGNRVIPLGCVALVAGVLALAASLAPALWEVERAYWLVRVTAAEHQPDLTLARKESLLRDSLRAAFHVLAVGAGSLALQLLVQLAIGALAGLAIARAHGSRLARILRIRVHGRVRGWHACRTALRSCVRRRMFGLSCGDLLAAPTLFLLVPAGDCLAMPTHSSRDRADAVPLETPRSVVLAAAFGALGLPCFAVAARASARSACSRTDSPPGSLGPLAAALASLLRRVRCLSVYGRTPAETAPLALTRKSWSPVT